MEAPHVIRFQSEQLFNKYVVRKTNDDTDDADAVNDFDNGRGRLSIL